MSDSEVARLLPPMRFAYADPPYLGCCGFYKHRHDDGCWDDLATHAALIFRLPADYPDGWALSCSTPSLRDLLPMCPDDVRVAAWVKPFAIFRPNVNPAYAWEPVIFRGGRSHKQRGGKSALTVRDWHSESIRLKGAFLKGAKPPQFGPWIADLLGATEDDVIDDLFPGTGAVSESWNQGRLHV